MKTEYTVAMELASACGAYRRCAEFQIPNHDAMQKHEKLVRWIERQFLPHGSGIDCGCKVDIEASSDEKIVITCGYHHMNEGGMYDGWTSHRVVVRSAFRDLKLSIRGRNRQNIHDYLYEVFDSALQEVCHKIEDGKNELGWYFDQKWTSCPLETIYGKE